MTIEPDRDDPVMAALRDLSVGEPDRARADRTRDRCLAALARQRGRARQDSRAFRPPRRRALEPALIAGASLLLLTEVISRALRHYGF